MDCRTLLRLVALVEASAFALGRLIPLLVNSAKVCRIAFATPSPQSSTDNSDPPTVPSPPLGWDRTIFAVVFKSETKKVLLPGSAYVTDSVIADASAVN